jgi:hypothetical protein
VQNQEGLIGMLHTEFSEIKGSLIRPYMDKGELNAPVVYIKFGKVPNPHGKPFLLHFHDPSCGDEMSEYAKV